MKKSIKAGVHKINAADSEGGNHRVSSPGPWVMNPLVPLVDWGGSGADSKPVSTQRTGYWQGNMVPDWHQCSRTKYRLSQDLGLLDYLSTEE